MIWDLFKVIPFAIGWAVIWATVYVLVMLGLHEILCPSCPFLHGCQ